MVKRVGISDVLVEVFSYGFVALFTLFCLLPFWVMVVGSFTDNNALLRDGYRLWPREWSTAAYDLVLQGQGVAVGYRVSVFVTAVGTALSLLVMSGLAYVMSIKRFKGRNKVAFFIYFTMVFSGGLVPWFIIVRRVYHLTDSLWALIIPPLMSPFWLFILRNFFNGLPTALIESAYMDGASDALILFKIVLPLSTPALATVGLFTAIRYWNDWFHGVMLLDKVDYRPLPVLLIRILNQVRAVQMAVDSGMGDLVPISDLPSRTIRLATACVILGPVVLFYPFAQRYFTKGLTMGAIKG